VKAGVANGWRGVAWLWHGNGYQYQS
jgi:hypothetical protein